MSDLVCGCVTSSDGVEDDTKAKEEEVTGDWRKRHNTELHDTSEQILLTWSNNGGPTEQVICNVRGRTLLQGVTKVYHMQDVIHIKIRRHVGKCISFAHCVSRVEWKYYILPFGISPSPIRFTWLDSTPLDLTPLLCQQPHLKALIIYAMKLPVATDITVAMNEAVTECRLLGWSRCRTRNLPALIFHDPSVAIAGAAEHSFSSWIFNSPRAA